MTGADLRKVRAVLGLTRPQLAGLLRFRGISKTTLYRWETDRANTSGAVGAPSEVPASIELLLRAMARRCRVRWPLDGRAPRCESCGR